MNKVLIPALLACAGLALDAAAVRADGWGFGWCSSSSGSFNCNFKGWCGSSCGPSCPPGCPPCGGYGGGGYTVNPQLGPWYNYWPMEAHFQTPAMPQYPYWPAPQAYFQGGYAPVQPPVSAIPGYLPYGSPAYSGQGYANPYQTVSYPGYWYGR
jgi:hypothetical protein